MQSLSASRIKILDDCKKLFYRKYITKNLPEEETSPFAELGGAVHKVLEIYRENLDMSRRDMVAILNKEFNPSHQFGFLKKQGYQILYKLDLKKVVLGELVAVELDFKDEFGGVTMRGIVDKVELVDGTLVITDYKTNKVPEPDQYVHQLAIYDMAMNRIYPDVPKKYELFYVRHNKVYDFSFPDDYPERVERAIENTAKTITENETNSMACTQ